LSATVIAAVSAQLSAQDIDELESVRLTIKVTDSRESLSLDLASLEQDFEILNTNTVSQSRFINGRGQSWVDYQITLQPKRTGTLVIPGIVVGGETTPTLELSVRPLSAQARQTIDERVFFENEVSASTIYVQSQLIVTRRLLYSQGVQLYTDLPGAPEIPDAVVLTLGETSSGTTERNSKTYGVVQQQYAIFPESSGTFTVPGISITASVRLLENNRVSRKGVRVGTDDEQITVLPVPAEYPRDKPWLPAENVRLFDVMTPQRPHFQVGDTLTHELLAHLEGNIGSIAPPLTMTLDDDLFRVYPQAPTIQDDTSGATVKGSRLQTHSIVPLKPGGVTIPANELVWWDTRAKAVRVARTEPRSLSVTGVAVAPAQLEAAQPGAAEPAAGSEAQITSIPWSAMLPAALGALAVLSLLGLTWLAWRIQRAARNRHRPKSALRVLRSALASGNANHVHDALGAYLSEFYACPRPVALRRFSASSEQAASALNGLNRHLYAHSETGVDVHLTALGKIISELRPHQTQSHKPRLPELYPDYSHART
jgi:hypothetical protein